MIPYGTFTFFLVAIIVLLPVIILGFLGKRSYIYNGLSTAIMIVVIFSSDKHNLFGNKYLSIQLISFVIYLIWQVLLIMGYYKSRQKSNTFSKFVIVMILSILPLAIVKVLQSSWLGGQQIHFHEHKLIEFVGFLGISYVTFKSVQLIMEIRDGSIKEIKVGKLFQFISFFPTVSSEPIDRYKRFVKDDKRFLQVNNIGDGCQSDTYDYARILVQVYYRLFNQCLCHSSIINESRRIYA